MDKVAAAAELAMLAEQAGQPELAKIALEFGLKNAIQLAPCTANPACGMRLDLSQLQVPKGHSSDSTENNDSMNSARTWQHYELESSNITVQEAGGVDTVSIFYLRQRAAV